MGKSETAKRALERAVEEETAAVRAELKVAQAQIRTLHETLGRIAKIAFGAGDMPVAPDAPLEKRTLPAAIAAAAAPAPAEEPIWHEPPIDLAEGDDMGPGRFL